jgi:hypothetical protein
MPRMHRVCALAQARTRTRTFPAGDDAASRVDEQLKALSLANARQQRQIDAFTAGAPTGVQGLARTLLRACQLHAVEQASTTLRRVSS